MQIRVQINYISAERFIHSGQAVPGPVHIQTNVNVVGAEMREQTLTVPFIVSISYSPSVAQISIKGEAVLSGNQEELQQLKSDYDAKKRPPPNLIQAITNTSLVEATVVSRSLNIPPPIPLPSMGGKQGPKDKEQPSYVA